MLLDLLTLHLGKLILLVTLTYKEVLIRLLDMQLDGITFSSMPLCYQIILLRLVSSYNTGDQTSTLPFS